LGEVKMLEITINTKQAIAFVWTFIAVAVSLIVTLGMGFQYLRGTSYSAVPWWLLIATFFGVFLVTTLPVYLLIALWGIATRYENE
jgi:uncharacterized membrane protein